MTRYIMSLLQCIYILYDVYTHIHSTFMHTVDICTCMYMYIDLHTCTCTCTYHNMSQRRSTNSSESNFDSTLRVNGGFIARELRT